MIELERRCAECNHINRLICDDASGAILQNVIFCSECKSPLYTRSELRSLSSTDDAGHLDVR